MAEFVIIAITLLFTILGVIQMALVLNAFTLVRYAAYNAARAGIVHGGDKDAMKEAARISLLATFPSHGRADTPRGFMENYLGSQLTDSNSLLNDQGEEITKVEIFNKKNLPCGAVVTFDDPVDAKDSTITVKVTHYYELVIPLVGRMLYYVYKQASHGGYQGEDVNQVAAKTDQLRRSGSFHDIEYRIPLVGVYTMRMQSDLVNEDC
jgi:hypothetical protein